MIFYIQPSERRVKLNCHGCGRRAGINVIPSPPFASVKLAAPRTRPWDWTHVCPIIERPVQSRCDKISPFGYKVSVPAAPLSPRHRAVKRKGEGSLSLALLLPVPDMLLTSQGCLFECYL